jgi:hypothetical protein
MSSNLASVVSDILFDCLQQKEQGDIDFKNMKYNEAIRNYKNAQICIEDFRRFARMKSGKPTEKNLLENIVNLNLEIGNKIAVIKRIQQKTITKRKETQQKNLDQFELLVQIMINEGNLDDLLKFVNISPRINEMIEIFLKNQNKKLMKEQKIIKINKQQISKVLDDLVNQTKKYITDCNNSILLYLHFLTTDIYDVNELGEKLKSNLNKLLIEYFEKQGFVDFRDTYYFLSSVPITISELDKIESEINQNIKDYIKEMIKPLPNSSICIKNMIDTKLFKITIKNYK